MSKRLSYIVSVSALEKFVHFETPPKSFAVSDFREGVIFDVGTNPERDFPLPPSPRIDDLHLEIQLDSMLTLRCFSHHGAIAYGKTAPNRLHFSPYNLRPDRGKDFKEKAFGLGLHGLIEVKLPVIQAEYAIRVTVDYVNPHEAPSTQYAQNLRAP